MRIAVAGGTGTVGQHVVDVVAERGHEPVVLTRSTGVDLLDAAPLADALTGADAVIDVSSLQTQSGEASEEFFGTVTRNLLAAETEAGVGHHIALSIVGAAAAPHGYYAGKALQERLVAEGGVPWSTLRATQFHEFAQLIHGQFTLGPIRLVPRMRCEPVAAREVAERLVTIAEGDPLGDAGELGGPQELKMIDMVRDYVKAIGAGGVNIEIPLPGGFGRALRDGTVLPAAGAARGTQTFAEWLAELEAAD